MNIFSGGDAEQLTGWRHDAYQQFKQRMLDPQQPFPCIFGVEAVVRSTLRYAFVDDAAGQAHGLAAALSDFTQVSASLGKRTSLVCFFESWSQERSHEAYHDHFWDLLRQVSALDVQEWPQGISADTDDPSFEWAFGGEPMFVVVNTDLHEKRRSRAFDRVAITFQPRFVFDDIAAGTVKGDEARRLIRARLSDYDDAPVTPLLGSFGDDANREWQQYYLDDGQDVAALRTCPVTGFRALATEGVS
ncbi:YqcI/YcgG family protein [Cellulomonas phragmiteti]|uniref:YqcI/YcgG family protein n=1 Tax=Cellulomonas phragmiteti TaxID=478780 RepID=A0ABQ4DPQ6_9CELL|nr:YqcI/YcgG family protein [Cellulomonas phragmiteti]GIG40972.1 hypothetical protein Cph01nite_27340 [Cellulomonas phragmiteti]